MKYFLDVFDSCLCHYSGVEQPSLAFILEHTEQLLKPRDSLYPESQAVPRPLFAALEDREDPKTTTANNHNNSVTPTDPRGME